MSSPRTVLGLVLVAVGMAAFPILLGATASRPDLVARVPSAYELNPGRSSLRGAVPPAEVDVGPDRERIRVDPPVGVASPGLELITWRADYGDAWHREVTWPSLAGPFAEEGSDVCGYRLQLGAGLFDTTAAGRGLKDAVERRLAELFPYSQELKEGIRVTLPRLSSSDFTITFEGGRAWVYVAVYLVDATVLSARFPVRLVSRNGTPAVERIREFEPKVQFTGPSRDEIVRQASEMGATHGGLIGLGGCLLGPAGCVLGALAGSDIGEAEGTRTAEKEIPVQASHIVTEKIDEALDHLALGMERLRQPWSPDPTRPHDSIRLRLGGAPHISSQGIALQLCASAVIGSPKVDPAIPGPVRWDAPFPELDADHEGSSTIGLTMNADALEQVIHYVWQAGKLRDLGRSSAVLGNLAEEVRMAAFDFTGLDAQLPPIIAPSISTADKLSFTLANVEAGTIGRRRVLAHGTLGLRMLQQDDAIQLSAEIADLRVNCIEPAPRGALLTPCLSDILPLARESAMKPIHLALPGGDVLAKLPRLSFQGMALQISQLRVETSGSPVQVQLRVQASIEAP
ncbi:hypothetical protein WME95_44635 [Sorangium sp. So ce327]|uniref:hypothetical protein n=1 Tax=Sorangium sp. So ce327 TaxID=3133301 RepID=UPI003F63D280